MTVVKTKIDTEKTPETKNVPDENANSLAVSETKATENFTELKFINSKTALAVFERLEEGIRMKEQFNRFKEKVDEFDDFAKNYDNEGLVMKIENIGTGDAIQLQSIPMILEFIKNVVVKTGRSHLKEMENEIVQFAI